MISISLNNICQLTLWEVEDGGVELLSIKLSGENEEKSDGGAKSCEEGDREGRS